MLTWKTARVSSPDSGFDIVFSASTDSGLTWTSARTPVFLPNVLLYDFSHIIRDISFTFLSLILVACHRTLPIKGVHMSPTLGTVPS